MLTGAAGFMRGDGRITICNGGVRVDPPKVWGFLQATVTGSRTDNGGVTVRAAKDERGSRLKVVHKAAEIRRRRRREGGEEVEVRSC